jgi:hypothetical protein
VLLQSGQLSAPLGPLLIGLLLEHIPDRQTLAIFATVVFALTLCGKFSPSLRKAPGLHAAPVGC